MGPEMKNQLPTLLVNSVLVVFSSAREPRSRLFLRNRRGEEVYTA